MKIYERENWNSEWIFRSFGTCTCRTLHQEKIITNYSLNMFKVQNNTRNYQQKNEIFL